MNLNDDEAYDRKMEEIIVSLEVLDVIGAAVSDEAPLSCTADQGGRLRGQDLQAPQSQIVPRVNITGTRPSRQFTTLEFPLICNGHTASPAQACITG